VASALTAGVTAGMSGGTGRAGSTGAGASTAGAGVGVVGTSAAGASTTASGSGAGSAAGAGSSAAGALTPWSDGRGRLGPRLRTLVIWSRLWVVIGGRTGAGAEGA